MQISVRQWLANRKVRRQKRHDAQMFLRDYVSMNRQHHEMNGSLHGWHPEKYQPCQFTVPEIAHVDPRVVAYPDMRCLVCLYNVRFAPNLCMWDSRIIEAGIGYLRNHSGKMIDSLPLLSTAIIKDLLEKYED